MGHHLLPSGGLSDGRVIEVLEGTPTAGEYNELREAVGWESVSPAVAAAGLEGTRYGVLARLGGHVVGMARLVGDGAIYLYVQDMIVHPEFQARGLGRRLIQALHAWVAVHCTEEATIALMAAPGAQAFYERLGYEPRPADAPGMELVDWPSAVADHSGGGECAGM